VGALDDLSEKGARGSVAGRRPPKPTYYLGIRGCFRRGRQHGSRRHGRLHCGGMWTLVGCRMLSHCYTGQMIPTPVG